MAPRRRASDNPAVGFFWRTLRKLDAVGQRSTAIISLIVATLSVGIAAYAVYSIQETVDRIEAEGVERRDQTCQIFESQHLANVDKLRDTYRFLDQLPRSEYGTTLTKALVRSLPALEQEARIDQAPPYCDEPGEVAEFQGAPPVGLPEPDPSVPPRRSFRRLLERP